MTAGEEGGGGDNTGLDKDETRRPAFVNVLFSHKDYFLKATEMIHRILMGDFFQW